MKVFTTIKLTPNFSSTRKLILKERLFYSPFLAGVITRYFLS